MFVSGGGCLSPSIRGRRGLLNRTAVPRNTAVWYRLTREGVMKLEKVSNVPASPRWRQFWVRVMAADKARAREQEAAQTNAVPVAQGQPPL